MVWPVLSKNDIATLCGPFNNENSLLSIKEQDFSGVVFFDVGSVLLDLDWEAFFMAISSLTKPSHKFSLKKFLTLAKQENINSIWSQGKISPQDHIKKLIELINLSCENNDGLEITAIDLKLVDSLVVASPRLKVLELAKKLRKKSFIVCLLSNTTPWHVQLIYEKLQVMQNFDVSIFSNDVGYEKPDEQIYRIAYREAFKFIKNKFNKHLETKDIYFVDDTPVNVKAALSLGWNARLVNLVKDEILNKLKHNEIDDAIFQQESQKRENLLFAEQAALRVEELFGNLTQ